MLMDKEIKRIVDNPIKSTHGKFYPRKTVDVISHELSNFLNNPAPRESTKWHMDHKPYGR